MNWNEIEDKLRPAYETMVNRLKEDFPSLSAGIFSYRRRGISTFRMSTGLASEIDVKPYEDVIIDFRCIRPGRIKDDLTFVKDPQPETLQFSIECGSGEELASLDPVLLPMDERSREYEEQVRVYADRAVAFLDAHLDTLIGVLETIPPYEEPPLPKPSAERCRWLTARMRDDPELPLEFNHWPRIRQILRQEGLDPHMVVVADAVRGQDLESSSRCRWTSASSSSL
jgi:hypothetical protein